MNVLLAAVIGLVLSVGGIFVIEYLDDTIKGSEDVIRATGLPVLGRIGRINGKDDLSKLIAIHQPDSPEVEAFRGISSNILPLLNNGGPKCLLIASPSPREGKSIITANIAVVLAQAGMRVILVDADLRKPKLHLLFGLPNKTGLRDALLSGDSDVKLYLQSTQVECLSVLTSGSSTDNPSIWLGSSKMKLIFEELKAAADVVLFDSPPFLIVADAGTLASMVDHVVLVVDAGNTRINEVRRVVEEFQQAHQNIKGVVINRAKEGGRKYHYYHYYYSDKPEKNPNKSNNHRDRIEEQIIDLQHEPASSLVGDETHNLSETN
jgi:polysaccharide biosynthesis transport protein